MKYSNAQLTSTACRCVLLLRAFYKCGKLRKIEILMLSVEHLLECYFETSFLSNILMLINGLLFHHFACAGGVLQVRVVFCLLVLIADCYSSFLSNICFFLGFATHFTIDET